MDFDKPKPKVPDFLSPKSQAFLKERLGGGKGKPPTHTPSQPGRQSAPPVSESVEKKPATPPETAPPVVEKPIRWKLLPLADLRKARDQGQEDAIKEWERRFRTEL